MRLLGREVRGWSMPAPFVLPQGWRGSGGVGVDVTRQSALGLSSVWACVRLLTSAVSRMPIDVFIDVDDIPQKYTEPRWLRQPILTNPNFGRVEHFAQVMVSALMEGNFFTLVVRDNSNDVSEVFNLDPTNVEITGTLQSPGYKVRVTPQKTVELGPDEVLHRPLLTLPGSSRGVSPLEAAYQVFGVGLASQEYAGRFFSQSSTPPGYIKVPQGSKLNVEELKQSWEEHHAGATNWHRPGVLTGGAEWAGIAITNEQAQFLEQRQFSVSEVARWYGVPPHMIGDVERSTSWGSGIEAQGLGFVTYSLNDYLVLIEEAYKSLVPNRQSYIRFNRNALLRGDSASRVAFYRGLWEMGALNADTIRAKEDMPPIPGGDGQIYYFPTRWTPVGTEGGTTGAPRQPVVGATEGPDDKAPPPLPKAAAPKGRDMEEMLAASESRLYRAIDRLGPPSVYVNEGAFQNHVTVEPAQPPVVNINEGAVRVDSPVTVERSDVNIAEGAVRVDSPITVEPPQLHIEDGAFPVTVQPSDVTIAEGAVRVDAPVTVERTDVNVQPADVRIHLPDPPEPRHVRKMVKRDKEGRITEISGGKVTKTVKRNDKGQITEIIEDEE